MDCQLCRRFSQYVLSRNTCGAGWASGIFPGWPSLGKAMQTLRSGLLFFCLAAIGFFLARYLAMPQAVQHEIAVDGCKLEHRVCVGRLPGGGEVQLSLTPRPVPLMKPLNVEARARDTDLQAIRLDITGLNMEMGLNRTDLVDTGGGAWTGETILPVCSQRRMHWQAALLLENATGKVRVLFNFHTIRP